MEWITNYSNLQFNCQTINELWRIAYCIQFKDNNIVDMIRVAVIWILWLEPLNQHIDF
jgi:hypothetical protein